jgi:hypothetical protein
VNTTLIWGRRRLAPFFLFLLVVGCHHNPTAVPTPAPIQVANSINEFAQVTKAAAVTLRSALDQGKISQADYNIAARVGIAIANVGLDLNVELRTADSWEVQKVKMRNIAISAGLTELAKALPPTARAIMATCLATFNAFSATVGGPIL